MKDSDYTNIYTYLDADKLSKKKQYLQEGEFQNERIKTQNIINKEYFINNFEGIIQSPKVLNLVKKNPLMKIMDELFRAIANSKILATHDLTLEVAYEDKEELGTDQDDINISIQLDLKSPD